MSVHSRTPRNSVSLWRCGLIFLLCYGAMMIPWPGWNPACKAAVIGAGNLIFDHSRFDLLIKFSKETEPPRESVDLRITVGNRRQASPDGKLPVKVLNMDTRAQFWLPAALALSLILASPLTGRSRWVALGWGVGGVVFYLLFTVGVFIWNQSLDLMSTNPDPILVRMGAGLEYTFISQMGVTFTAPVVIWGIAFLAIAKFEMGNGK